MGEAIRYIEGRFEEQLTLDEMARISNMSRFYFARRFKEATGHSFKEFLNRRRVQEAKDLMKRDGLNISQACYAVGFGDLSYFGRVFRRIEGQSPSDYKKGLKSLKTSRAPCGARRQDATGSKHNGGLADLPPRDEWKPD
jgi:AraC-like DNA-binding protein